MYSKTTELLGIVAIAIAIASWARWEAGLLFFGISLLFIGATTDDAAVSFVLRNARNAIRHAWQRQMLKEQLYAELAPHSPHPPLRVNAETDRWAKAYAKFYAGLRPKPDRATEGTRGRSSSREAVAEAEDNGTFDRLA